MHTRFLAVAVIVAGCSAAWAQPQLLDARAQAIAALEANPALVYSPNSVLVKFRPQADLPARAAARAQVAAATARTYTIVPGLELLTTTLPVEQAIVALRNNPAVEYAEPDHVVRTTTTIPNDTYFHLQWGAHNTGQTVNGDPGTAGADINAPEAWSMFTGDPNFVIAIIDTGTQWNHPDLSANIWTNLGEIPGNGLDDDGNGYVDDVRGWDFYNNDNDPSDPSGHGTHTAGTVGAIGNNGTGVAGMMWQCKLMPLRFLGPQGGYTSDAVLAVQYAANKGVKVSNNSWGGGGFNQALYDAINASKNVGHIFVAAAGNGGFDQIGDNNDQFPYYPASYNLDNIIAVAATNNDDGRATFSNYGLNSVDLGAPGVNIASTYPTNNYAWSSGTSMAAPHVAGVVGLVYAANPTWTYGQVRQRILTTTRPVSSLANITVTGGVLDAAAALSGVTSPPVLQPPAAPGTPSLTKFGGGQVRVSWSDNSNNEEGFHIERERKSGPNWIETVQITVGENVNTITDAPGSGQFRYRVRAFNAAGVSAWSAWKSIKI
jgi:subtilisin family serine protease